MSNPDAEKEVVSRLMTDPKLIKEVYGLLEPDDFTGDDKAREVYTLMCKNFKEGREWSMVSIMDELRHREPKIFASDYLMPETVGPGQFLEIVDRLREKSLKRRVLLNAAELSHDTDTFTDKGLGEIISSELDFYTHLPIAKDQKDDMESLVVEHKRLIEERRSGKSPRIPTGFTELDNMLAGGFQRQDFIVIGARPSVGKTALSLTFAYNAAKAGLKTLFISVEMRGQDIVDRLLAFETNSSCTRIIRGDIEDRIRDRGYEELRKLPLSIYELYNATSDEAYSVASKEKYKNGLDLVIVDYIQVLRDVPEDERVNAIQISRNLKMMARLLNVAVIAPSQLTRKSETQGGDMKGVPMLHHLRESGNIESDADLVLLLYRDLNDKPDDTRLNIAKNRKGETGSSRLKFNNISTRFE